MPDKMSKRKRENSSSDTDEVSPSKIMLKKSKNDNLEKNEAPINEVDVNETNSEVKSVEPESSNGELNKSINSAEDKSNEMSDKETKKEDSVDSEEKASTSASDVNQTEVKSVEPESSNSELNKSINSTEDKSNGTSDRKRKREDSVEEKASTSSSDLNKIEVKDAEKEIEEEGEEEPPRKKSKKIYRKRISRNECVCTPVTTQPLQEAEVDTDAHIQVDEWRLHKFQSPIELKHEESIHHDHFDPLEFHGHWDKSGEATFTNNGFTATLRLNDRNLPILKGGPLHEDEYVFEQLHFHWSEDDHSGCEHIFEGRAYSMEAHAVHINRKYGNFKNAHDKPDGLSVIAFFIQATDNKDNPCFNKLCTAVKDIIKINTTTTVPSDCLTWFKEEAQCKGYYTYQGSLTTEPYTESVTWILYPQPIHVSREQVASFRSLHSTPCEQHNIKKNVRPIQTPPEHKKLNVVFARSHRHSTSE